MTYMVLYIHSIALYVSHLFIRLMKNLVLRAKLSNSYILYKRKHASFPLGRVLDQAYLSIPL